MLAELLIRMVQATAAGLTLLPLSSREAAAGVLGGQQQQEEELLPPMTPNNYETNTSSCWLGVRVQRAAAAASCVALSTPQRLWQCSCPCIVRAAGALPSLLLPCTTELRWLTSAACFAGLFSCIGGCC